MIQNTKASFNKFMRSVVGQVKTNLSLSTLEYRPWNKKTEYPVVKWFMGQTLPPIQRQGLIYKHMSLFTIAVFVDNYNEALCCNIIDQLIENMGFSLENSVFQIFIDKLDYVNQSSNNNELILLDSMHVKLKDISNGSSLEPSETTKQILLDVFHN